MPKKKIAVRSNELKRGDVIVYSSDLRPGGVHWLDVEREEPYKTGTILLIKSGTGTHGADYTLEQVVHRIADSSGGRGSWLSTRGGVPPVEFYSRDTDIEALIAKSGGVEVLREGTGA